MNMKYFSEWALTGGCLLLCVNAHQRESPVVESLNDQDKKKNDNDVAEVYLFSRPRWYSFAERKNEVDKVAGIYLEKSWRGCLFFNVSAASDRDQRGALSTATFYRRIRHPSGGRLITKTSFIIVGLSVMGGFVPCR